MMPGPPGATVPVHRPPQWAGFSAAQFQSLSGLIRRGLAKSASARLWSVQSPAIQTASLIKFIPSTELTIDARCPNAPLSVRTLSFPAIPPTGPMPSGDNPFKIQNCGRLRRCGPWKLS
jgi:hypothetical protein